MLNELPEWPGVCLNTFKGKGFPILWIFLCTWCHNRRTLPARSSPASSRLLAARNDPWEGPGPGWRQQKQAGRGFISFLFSTFRAQRETYLRVPGSLTANITSEKEYCQTRPSCWLLMFTKSQPRHTALRSRRLGWKRENVENSF